MSYEVTRFASHVGAVQAISLDQFIAKSFDLQRIAFTIKPIEEGVRKRANPI